MELRDKQRKRGGEKERGETGGRGGRELQFISLGLSWK